MTDHGAPVPPTPPARQSSSRPIEELRDEARYHRQRYELYQAKVYGSRPTSASRLRELERAARDAQERLERASQ